MSTKSSSHFMLFINILHSDLVKIRRVIQRAVKGLLVIREYPIIFPVKCEMVCFLRVNRDTIRNRKMWLSKIITGILVVTSISIFPWNVKWLVFFRVNRGSIRNRKMLFSKIILTGILVVTSISIFPWNVKWLVFFAWIMMPLETVKCDFPK